MKCITDSLKGTNKQHSGHVGPKIQIELMAKIDSKSLVRAIGKVLLIKNLGRTSIKIRKGDEKWPLFVNNQLFWWST